jgi:hypothetical protein
VNELLKELLPNPWAVDYQEPHDGRGFDLYDERKMIEYGHRIVRECLGVVEGGRFLHDEAPTAQFARECAGAIRRHFGIQS